MNARTSQLLGHVSGDTHMKRVLKARWNRLSSRARAAVRRAARAEIRKGTADAVDYGGAAVASGAFPTP